MRINGFYFLDTEHFQLQILKELASVWITGIRNWSLLLSLIWKKVQDLLHHAEWGEGVCFAVHARGISSPVCVYVCVHDLFVYYFSLPSSFNSVWQPSFIPPCQTSLYFYRCRSSFFPSAVVVIQAFARVPEWPLLRHTMALEYVSNKLTRDILISANLIYLSYWKSKDCH